MISGKGLGAAAIALMVGMSAVPATSISARAGALDSIFKSPLQRIREHQARQEARQERQRDRAWPMPPADPEPIRRISGPSYKTYVPDRLVRIDFNEIVDPVVTASTRNEIGLPPLGVDVFAEGRSVWPELEIRALPETAKAVVATYSEDPDYLWVAGTGINDAARAVLAVLADADKVGLSSTDYEVEVPTDSYDIGMGRERQRELMRFEMELSAAVADYILDATRGRIDPNRISGYHDFKRKTVDLAAALQSVASADDAGEALSDHNPQGAHFAAMVAELARLQQADPGQRVEIAPDLLLKPGESSSETQNVVAAIRLKGSEALKAEHALLLASYRDNAEYDPDIVALVKDFQREAGLSPDGVVGPRTVRALVGETNASKIEKVRLAMERARWLPGVLAERRVFINQPAFTASYHEDGKEVFETRTVIGTKANQTYFFDDRIETVEFNPYWGVPQSIIINEMLPKLRQDPSYLDRLGYEVTYHGRSVSSSAVNWWAVERGTVGVRQPPGDDNALGELKILFPNSHAIYMHDTPSKSLFERDMRAFSHGCVRLQDPRGMAARVLGSSVGDIGEHIAGGGNKAVEVPVEIPVHVAYFTAWPDDSGTMHYYADIYERDAYLRKALDATASERHAAS